MFDGFGLVLRDRAVKGRGKTRAHPRIEVG